MDFLGTTTANSIVANVTSGVQTTGEALWPFLIFVGVPMAFVIGGFLVSFIRGSVGRVRSR